MTDMSAPDPRITRTTGSRTTGSRTTGPRTTGPRTTGPRTTGRPPGAGPLLAAQVRYQLLLLSRNPRAMILSLVFPLLILVLNSTARHDVSPQLEAALVAGLATFGLIATAYVSHAIGLVTSRQDGVLRRWRATPLPAWCFFAGKIAATALMALASVAIAVAGGIALFHAHVTPGAALSLLVTFTLGALAWTAIGTAVTTLIPAAQSAGPVLMLTYIPVILFSGALGSQAGAPPLAVDRHELPARQTDHQRGSSGAAAQRRRDRVHLRAGSRGARRLGRGGRDRVGPLLPVGPGTAAARARPGRSGRLARPGGGPRPPDTGGRA